MNEETGRIGWVWIISLKKCSASVWVTLPDLQLPLRKFRIWGSRGASGIEFTGEVLGFEEAGVLVFVKKGETFINLGEVPTFEYVGFLWFVSTDEVLIELTGEVWIFEDWGVGAYRNKDESELEAIVEWDTSLAVEEQGCRILWAIGQIVRIQSVDVAVAHPKSYILIYLRLQFLALWNKINTI